MAEQPNNQIKQRLSGMASQMPGQSQQFQNRLNQTRMINMKQQLGQAQGPLTTQQTQQAAASQQQQIGQAQVQAEQAKQQGLQQVAGMGLQQQTQEDSSELFKKQMNNRERSNQLAQRLTNTNRELGDKLFNDNLTFQKDEMGRQYFNERQLADWAIMKAESEEEFRDFEQQVMQASQKRMQTLGAAHAKIKQALEQDFQADEAKLSREQTLRLTKAKQELERKIQKEKAKRSNRASMFSAAGTIAGTAVGAYFGGPAGAMAGAKMGEGLGSVVAGSTE